MIGEIFYWVFNMSLAATICMIPVFLLRFIKKIPRRFFVWFWSIPFFRLCIPVAVSSKYGIMALLSNFATKTITVYEFYKGPSFSTMNIVMLADTYFPITYKVNVLEKLFNIASVIWLAVALIVVITVFIIYFTSIVVNKKARHLEGNVYLSEKIKTPAVYGIIKPKIVIPVEYETDNLDYILLHEKAHIKRKDNLIRLLALLVVCIHWFNPFAWLLLKMLYSDMELACDETVLSKCNETQRKEYANALLSATEKTNIFVAAFGGAKIKNRIENILSYKKMTFLSVVAFSALIITIAYLLLTNAG